MKTYTKVAGTIAALALIAAPALAHNEASAASPSVSAKVKAEQRRDEVKQKIQEKKAEIKEKVSDKQKQKIANFWDNMTKRLEILIRNQRRLADQISNRLDKLSAEGKDVTAARAKLADAKKMIQAAEDALHAGTASIASIVAQNDPKTALQKVRQLNKDVLEKIKDAHHALVDVMKAVKEANVKTSPTSSPTPTPTVQ